MSPYPLINLICLSNFGGQWVSAPEWKKLVLESKIELWLAKAKDLVLLGDDMVINFQQPLEYIGKCMTPSRD